MSTRGPGQASDLLMKYGISPMATAGFFVLLAFYWTLLLQHIIAYPFVFLFFGAVIGSAWFGGTIAGFLSVLLSSVLVAYFFVPPLFSMTVSAASKSYLIAFILCATAMSWASSARKRSESAVRQARDHLEERVMERTAEILRSNQEIIESERRLRLLTEAIPQQIWSAAPDGSVEHCNLHLLDYVGCSAEEMLGDRFLFVVHSDDRDSFRESWASALASGSKFEGEWRIRGAGGRYRWFLVRSIPQVSSSGEITRWYGTHIDIEESRRVEQALVQAQAELSDVRRTLSMGELAASIAHELNQPLTALVTQAYACREWLAANPVNLERAYSTAEKIVRESTRASAVVDRIRALFQLEPQTRERVDINVIIQSLLRLLRDQAIQRGIIIRTHLATDLPLVGGDSVQIQQVLLNLAMNGMDAIAAMNPADLKASMKGLRELSIVTERSDAGDVLVRVEDCGVGLDPETAAKIFQPFFTTKPHGVGLGLAISRSIIEAHDGRLWATPRQQGGAAFQFTIPAVSIPAVSNPAISLADTRP